MSGAIKIILTEHDAMALHGFAARARDVAQSRRLLAIEPRSGSMGRAQPYFLTVGLEAA